jgi:hypothetical protein
MYVDYYSYDDSVRLYLTSVRQSEFIAAAYCA